MKAPDGSATVPKIESAYKLSGPASPKSNKANFGTTDTGFRDIDFI
jgi:hypothetical protein